MRKAEAKIREVMRDDDSNVTDMAFCEISLAIRE